MGNGMCFGKGPPPNVLSRSIFLSRSLWCTFYPFMFGWNFAFLSFLCLGFVCIPFKLIQIFLSDCSGVCRAAARQGWLYNRLENVLEGGVGSLGSLRWRSAARCSVGDEVICRTTPVVREMENGAFGVHRHHLCQLLLWRDEVILGTWHSCVK